ncbi:MAG TPA: phosphodiester glycosidase family protein, partial [Actinomycetota bacterium]|nr:phosphodiester glycosidase family protein [Actinomycetota bacterium]
MRQVRLLVLILLVAPLPARAQTLAPAGFSPTAQEVLVRGVTRYAASQPGRQMVHVARIDAGAAVRIGTGLAFDRVAVPQREPTSSLCRRMNCLVGVNGDFFSFETKQPMGGMVDNGVMVRSPSDRVPHLVETEDGRWRSEPLGWSASVTYPGADSVPLAGVNITPVPDSVVLYTAHWQASTSTGSDSAEMTVGLSGPVAPAQVQALAPRAFTDGVGNAAVPPDGAVLSGHGAGAEALRRLWARMQPSDDPASLVEGATRTFTGEGEPKLELRSQTRVAGVRTVIGGGPVLAADGKVAELPTSAFSTRRHPRTVVGWNDAGQRWMVTADGRQPGYSEGMTLYEAARFVLDLGATDVLNLDGGGSTTFVKQGRVVNRPVNGQPGTERPVANALLAMATEPLT